MRLPHRRSGIPLTLLALAAAGPVLWVSEKPSGTVTADANVGAVSASSRTR